MAKRLFPVDFSVNLRPDESSELQLKMKKGDLWLTLRSLVLGSEDLYYEIQTKDIEDIRFINHLQPRLEIAMAGGFVLTVRGSETGHLMALRHYLLPFVKSKERAS